MNVFHFGQQSFQTNTHSNRSIEPLQNSKTQTQIQKQKPYTALQQGFSTSGFATMSSAIIYKIARLEKKFK
jgi:hypothetical protein